MLRHSLVLATLALIYFVLDDPEPLGPKMRAWLGSAGASS